MEKYLDKFLNQTYKLEDAIIGMEFEFYMNKKYTYYKTLELLNQILTPVKVWGFRVYHADFVPDGNNFKLESDLSGGVNMAELITSPLTYYNAKYYLIKICKFIQDYGYTTDKASIHFNISFSDESKKNLLNINMLKLILNIDEDEIYNVFPMRKNNVYAKSVKNIVPFKEYDFFNIPIETVKNNIRIPNDKYYGINFMHITDSETSRRLEFRYIGGKDYEKNTGNLIYFLDKFIINTYDCVDSEFTDTDKDILYKYLKKNISLFKNFSQYDTFITEFPTISLQVDKISDYSIVSAYYSSIYNKLYDVITKIDNLKDCIINYVSETKIIEIIDTNIKTLSTIDYCDFIDCKCNGIFTNCYFVGCDVTDSQTDKCKYQNSSIISSKVENCVVETSTVENCYFVGGFLNCEMNGGVFRSGKLGPYSSLDSDVKVVTNNSNNFFNKKFGYDDKKDLKNQTISKEFDKNPKNV